MISQKTIEMVAEAIGNANREFIGMPPVPANDMKHETPRRWKQLVAESKAATQALLASEEFRALEKAWIATCMAGSESEDVSAFLDLREAMESIFGPFKEPHHE